MTVTDDAERSATPLSDDESMLVEIQHYGVGLGELYERIWDSLDDIAAIITPVVNRRVEVLLSAVPKGVVWRRMLARILFWSGVAAFVIMLFPGNQGLVALWLLISFAWLVAGYAYNLARKDHETLTAKRRAQLNEVGVVSALETVLERQQQARAHTPSLDSSLPFTPRGAMPAPQPFGVSHQGAEALCAEWMRFYGEADAETTQFTADGGIDVTSLHYIAQVKNYAGTVGVGEIREMAGTALDDGRRALFFTSGSYAAGAVAFADRVSMPLFIYNAEEGTLVAANGFAEGIFSTGL